MKYFNKTRTIEQKMTDRDVLFQLKKTSGNFKFDFGRIKKF